ncbi:hypothetical protein HME9302_00746 [Alteripontixanthobacter maritimus]|uniref:DUF1570 domain-containing protein n=1 Tax=Alteripontixanthobacter maritimus TaxID=2161824 RepID=A0A369Q8T2_9SPHN|nr:hypothetical protein [Alteripontixanthobacter maritimus]RDC59556.1 hypothetical protein HME9302_00746 [Alteripontixanthobacter maritimus]
MSLLRFTKLMLVVFAAIGLGFSVNAKTWHRADTHHFTIYSDGRQSDLEDFAHEAEKFDALLRMLWKKPVQDTPTKLTIFMVSESGQVASLIGQDNVAGFYVPQVEGSFAVSNRQKTRDKRALSGQQTLFHEYAHHFFFNNFSIPTPSWFVEGFAEFVATAEFKKNGEWYFGRPAFHRAGEIEYFGAIDVRDLLTLRPGQMTGRSRNAFYGWSWVLTHMLYSKERDRGDQLNRYLMLLNSGIEAIPAAEQAFGSIDQLDRDMRDYADGRMGYSKSDTPIAYKDTIAVKELGEMESQLVGLRMRRLGRASLDEARDELRELTRSANAPAQAFAELGLAEYAIARREAEPEPVTKDGDDETDAEEGDAEEGDQEAVEYTATLPDYALADAAFDAALERDPAHGRANVYKAKIAMDRLWHADDWDDEKWDAARKLILLGNRADPYDALPLYEYARSFSQQGKHDPQVSVGYETAFAFTPEANDVRAAYALDLAANGKYNRALALVQILANNPHNGARGRYLVSRIAAMQQQAMDDDSDDGSEEDGSVDVIVTDEVEADVSDN